MKLYELIENVSIQGNIEVKQLLVNGDTKWSLSFDTSEGLMCSDFDEKDLELEVKYIYSEKYDKYFAWGISYPHARTIIEVGED